jgi:DNA polymerase (family 10)
VAGSFARISGVREARSERGGSVSITYVDGTHLDLHCVEPEAFAAAFWRATGSVEHVTEVSTRLGERGFAFDGDRLVDERHAAVPVPDEA